MESRASTSRYILVALCIILVITAFILIGLNALNLQHRLGINLSSSSGSDQYRQGYMDAKAKFQTECPLIGRDSSSISGTIVSLTDYAINLKQTSFDTNETLDGISDLRTANITKSTTLKLLVQKSADVFGKEMAAYKPTPGQPVNPPSQFTESNASFSDLKVGDTVNITSNTNLRLAGSFTAVSVIVNR